MREEKKRTRQDGPEKGGKREEGEEREEREGREEREVVKGGREGILRGAVGEERVWKRAERERTGADV